MKKIIENTALFSTYIILCGVIKYYIYYKHFGILILQFAEIQEMLTLFLENLLAYLVLAVIVTINFYFIFIFKAKYNRTILKRKDVFKVTIKALILLAVSVISVFIYFKSNEGVDYIDLYILLAFFLLVFILHLIWFLFFIRRFNIKIEGVIIILSVLLMGHAIANGFNESRKVEKNDNIFYGVELKMKENPVIVSNDSLTFVGMTKNYIFIYNKHSKFSTVYRTEDMESIKFPKK